MTGNYFKRLSSASSVTNGNTQNIVIVKPSKLKRNGEGINVKKINPYIEKTKLPQVQHPLENIPEFLRFDMNSKSTKTSLPVVK